MTDVHMIVTHPHVANKPAHPLFQGLAEARVKYFTPRLVQTALAFLVVLVTGVSASAQRRLPEPTPTVVNPVFRSEVRGFLSLDGEWQFALDPDEVGEKERWFATDRPFSRTIHVPGAWEAEDVGPPGFSHPTHVEGCPIPLRNEYVGSAWYRKLFRLPVGWSGKRVWLKIGGVNSQGWFWVNGTNIGFLNHYCGAYKFDISPLLVEGENTIVARVSNKALSRKGLLNWLDQFGGFYRSVELEATTSVYIDDVWARPDFDTHQAVFLMTLFAPQRKPATGHYRLLIDVLDHPR